MTCNNCVHYDVCKFHGMNVDGTNFHKEFCGCFKDKSRFIELPCAIGDDVYVIEFCSCLNGYREAVECHHRTTKATKFISAVKCTTKHYTRCAKLFVRPFKAKWINKIGKTVFFTREEAEKKLQEIKE